MFTADLHTHTVACVHAYSTINEYAAYAAACGIRLFATTDHGPSMPDGPMEWHFMNLRVLPRIMNGVAILQGIEANILDNPMYPEHPLDCRDSVLKELDIVLAGLHGPCQLPLDKKGNTRLLLNAIQCGRVQVITHPGNPAFPIDAREVAEAATACHVALEINNSSATTRKGSTEICIEIAKAQRDAGGWLAVSSDAHHSHSLGNFAKALDIVKAAEFPEERIINISPKQVLHFLRTFHGKSFPDLEEFFAIAL